MQINLYTISKRKNSTGLPTGSPYTITCVLKENTDVLSPSFLLQDKPTLAYNYLEWQGLYYWINDITYETNNLWRIDCSIDVLASYRTDILATSCFLEYASGGNTRLVDPRLAKQINAHEIVNSSALPSAVYDDAGTLIMNVVGYGCSGAVGIGDKTSANIVKMILDQASNWYDQLSNFDTSSVEEAIKSIGRIAFSGDANGAIRGLYWMNT